MSDSHLKALLDSIDARKSERRLQEPAITRDDAEMALGAILRLYSCHESDAGVVYAFDSLYRALGIDWNKSKIVFMPGHPPASNDPD